MPWYRTIKPEDELKILTIRDRLSKEQLQVLQPYCPPGYMEHKELEDKCPGNFTRLSAFQYIATGAKQHFFSDITGDSSEIGIILRPYNKEPRQVLWRDSIRGEVSDNFTKCALSDKEFAKALADNRFKRMSEIELSDTVHQSYAQLRAQYIKERLNPNNCTLPWTEGLFRYHQSEIDGIVVNPASKDSCRKGYAFARVIEQKRSAICKFYQYDTNKLEFVEYPREQVKTVYNESKHQVKVLFDKYTSAITTLEKSQEKSK